jgi:phage-related protein
MYRVDRDAVVIAEVFAKKTPHTPREVIDTCIRRLREYDHA